MSKNKPNTLPPCIAITTDGELLISLKDLPERLRKGRKRLTLCPLTPQEGRKAQDAIVALAPNVLVGLFSKPKKRTRKKVTKPQA